MRENLFAIIPHKSSEAMIAAYTDYESDKNGDYTFFIGAQVSHVDKLPEGMVSKTIPSGVYHVHTTTKGPVWEVVQTAWKKIWESDKGRTYQFDYEIYDQRAMDPQQAEVDLVIGMNL